jgi:hypothetical protein
MPSYSLNTHAPDQTPLRPLLLHSLLDLTAPGRCYLKLEAIFMAFRGPKALTDTFEKIGLQRFVRHQPLQLRNLQSQFTLFGILRWHFTVVHRLQLIAPFVQ